MILTHLFNNIINLILINHFNRKNVFDHSQHDSLYPNYHSFYPKLHSVFPQFDSIHMLDNLSSSYDDSNVCANSALDIKHWILDLPCSLYHHSLQNGLCHLLLKTGTPKKKKIVKYQKKNRNKNYFLIFFFLIL